MKKRKLGRKLLSFLLTLALVLGLMPGMGLTAYAAPTETLLTTITATGKEQASYSTANVATVSFSYTAGGSSAYLANWGWWGYGWTATVNAAEGYTITKCVFYDDANRTDTDSSSPFVVETTEEDKTPRINGTPIDGGEYQSKGLKKIEVYGYATPAPALDPVSYMAWNGTTLVEKTGDDACTDYTVVTADTTTFEDGKWYVMSNSVTVSSRITVTGTVNLILCDGATLNASKGITVNSGNTINIYAQIGGTGELNAGSDLNVASIGGGARYQSSGTVNIHGGKITATGGSNASGIGGALDGGNGEVNIYGGNVTARGQNFAAGIGGYSGKSGGTVNIYGGTVNASGSQYGTTGIGIGGTNPGNCVVHIYGGEVTATSEKAAAGIQGTVTIDGGTVTATGGVSDSISSFGEETYSSNGINGTVTVNGGTVTAFGGNVTGGYAAIKSYGGTIYACSGISGTVTISGGTVTATGGNVTGDINNSGGTIYACNGVNGTVTISGGTVTATGGSHTGNSSGTTVKEKGFGGSLTLGTGMYLYGGTSANPESNLSNYRAGAGDYTGDRYVYMTVNNVVPHTHSFTYTATGATITAACTAGCDITEGLALTISAPTELTYDGSAKAATLSTGYNTTAFPGEYMIKYYKGANEVEAANVKAAGDYTAKVTVGEATASVDFTIAKATPSIETIPTASAVTYGQKLADSTLTGGTGSVAGGFAWKDSTVAPAVSDSQNTEYDVVFTPTDENYDAAECKVKLTVNKADSAVTTAPTAKTLTYNGSAQSLINAGTASGGTMKYAVTTANQEPAAEAYTFDNTSLPTSTNAGTYYVWYMVVGNENYNDSEPACVEVTVSTNKAAMSEEIDAADNFYNEIKEDYPEIADELSRVIKDAVAVKDNPDATQDEINAAEKAVKDATSNAKEILIQINHFVEGINDITQVGEDNKDDIKDLLASYDELPDSIRTAVDNKIGRAGTKKLSDLEDALEVVDKIDSIETAENIKLSDEEAVTIARTAYELLSESEKALISGDVIEKLEAAEAKIEELKNNEALNAAKASAIGRLEDYVDAKALSDATQDEDKAIKDVVDAEIEKINAAADMDAVAKALTAAKAAVDAALAKIAEDRAAAAAAAQEMAEADDALETAKENAESAIKAADEAAADEYASGTDKKAISDAKDAVEKAVNAAEALSDTASATAKKAAAKAIEDAVAALNEAVDKATVNSDAARAKAEEEADAAAQLEAAKDSAIDRLNDYSEAKALADATDTEKEAYNKAVTDGKTAIEAATTIEAVAAALANAKAAVDAALAKIAEDRAAAAAAAQEMAEADEAVADALVYADVSKADAVEAAEDEYASNADKQDIATAMATLEGAINAAKQLAADASAETKREAAKAVMDAAAALDQVVDAAKVRSAAAKAAATELAAARASACERLDDYSEAKALADATDAEKEAYNKAVTDGKTAINAAATTEAVAEALKAAKAAVDAALAKIAEDRAAAAEAAAEMEEADESLELARTIAGLAKAEAEKAANDEYASDTDKNAITTAKATLEGAINAAAQLAADASAEAKRAAAQTIVNAANALYDVCETAERNSAAAKADAEAAAAAAAALAAAREYACERLDDFTDAKALDDATEAEQKEYDDVIAAEKEKINAAADQAAIDEALKAAKAAVNAELAKIKDDRTKAAAVVEMISGLPATEEIVLDDKEAVEAARTAYDALTDDQKLKVSDEVVKTLEDAEDMVVIRQVKSEIIARTGMIYNGQAFQLIDTPETDLPDGFTMMYAVTTENVEPDALEYAEDIPEAVEFGTYYVWFKVVDEQDNIWGGVSSVEVTIIRPTEIVTQPAAAKVIRGSKAKFSVEATGDDLTYVWQISKDGVNWSNSTASGCDTDKITFRATKALNGRYYRCVITGAGGVVISDAVKLTTLAVINGQPGDAAATIGSDVTFSVSSRSSAATYQWQVSTDGGETWKKSSAEGCDTDHLTVNVKSAKYGEYLFRCKVTNGTWVEYSKAAGIDIVTFIVKQPETIFASEGDKVKLYVKATGIAPTYQWEVMTGAGNWVNSTAPGNATNIITFKATAVKTAYKWRCKITDGDTVLYSDVVTLVIESGQYED